MNASIARCTPASITRSFASAVTEHPWSKALRWKNWRFVHYQREMFNGEDVGEARSYHLDAGGILVRQGDGYLVKFPVVRVGSAKTFASTIAPQALHEDGVSVSVASLASDFTFWSNEPQSLAVKVANVDQSKSFRADLVLRLRSYLTKAVFKEERRALSIERGSEKGLCAAPRFVFNASALQPPEAPSDFDEFWRRTLEDLAKIPPDLKVAKVRDEGEHEVYKFSFAGLLGHRCYGWLTLPKDKLRKWPAVLALPPAGMRGQPVRIYLVAVGMRIASDSAGNERQVFPRVLHRWQSGSAVGSEQAEIAGFL